MSDLRVLYLLGEFECCRCPQEPAVNRTTTPPGGLATAEAAAGRSRHGHFLADFGGLPQVRLFGLLVTDGWDQLTLRWAALVSKAWG